MLQKIHPSHQGPQICEDCWIITDPCFLGTVTMSNTKGCSLVSIANSWPGKSLLVQLFQFVLCDIWHKRTLACNHRACVLLQPICWDDDGNVWTEAGGVVSTLMRCRPMRGQGSKLSCDCGPVHFLCLCLSFSVNLLITYFRSVTLFIWDWCIVCQGSCNPQLLWEWKGLPSLFLTGSNNSSLLTRPL